MECKCNVCGMGVKGIACSKCNESLVSETITPEGKNKIQVAKCPNGCGQIKSPVCCGQDMACS
ncbi:hypothetical protein TUM19329_20250 [Legionella antarctica]|uniref:Uncharacterized protein n=1 Tax=Legionella antarctica TaxID=2708020 RepID=A0A6F8T4Q5_9GAMM|nr:hypothetical protein TUM19329_20250 [Legionella antarctica]